MERKKEKKVQRTEEYLHRCVTVHLTQVSNPGDRHYYCHERIKLQRDRRSFVVFFRNVNISNRALLDPPCRLCRTAPLCCFFELLCTGSCVYGDFLRKNAMLYN